MERDEALNRLEAIGTTDEVTDADLAWVRQQLESDAAEVRAEACALLGELLSPAELLSTTEGLVEDAAPEVRAAFYEAVGVVLHEAEEHDLLDLQGRPAWVLERGWVAPEDALSVLAVLQHAARDGDEDIRVRAAALRSLGYVAHLEDVDALVAAFLARPEPEARQAALAAAAASGLSDRWAAPVTDALGDEDGEVRAAAALAAGQLQLQDAAPYLEAMTLEGGEEERLAAAISSLLLTEEDEREALVEQLSLRGVPAEVIEEAMAAVADLDGYEDEEEEEEEEEGDEG